jgi:hypothetical protein
MGEFFHLVNFLTFGRIWRDCAPVRKAALDAGIDGFYG